MAQAGNSYTVTLYETHLKWGIVRYSSSRIPVYGEGYIPIPRRAAKNYNIFNSNYNHTGFGYNKYWVTSKDGFLNHEILLAQGCKEAGDIYAKQFSVEGDLKRIGQWYNYRNAKPGDRVEVTWVSPTEIEVDII